MDTFSQNFRTWMDTNHLTAAQVAEALHMEVQTVRNWRATGISVRSQRRVAEWMAAYDLAKYGDLAAALQARPIVLEATREELRYWSEAALAAGRVLEDWAKDGLNELAEQKGYGDKPNPLKSLPDLKVAEDSTDYLPKKGNGA